MIDEKRLIKKLDNRIDTFVKQHPEEKDCLAVQSVREFKQMIEAEVKEQEKGKSLESELLGRLDDMKESKESFCGEQVRRCGNAVCPPIPAALVRSNLPEMCVAERMPNITKDRVETEENGQLAFA